MIESATTENGRRSARAVCARLEQLDAERQERFLDVQRRPCSIAVVFTYWTIADDDHAFFGPLVRSIRARAATAGSDLILCAPSRDHWLEENAVERVVAHRSDGLLVLGGADGNPAVLAARSHGLPTVFVEFDSLGSRSAHVGIDNEKAFSEVVTHLALLGRTRIATITGPLDMRVSADRLAAYRSSLRRFGYEVRPEYIEVGDFLQQSGYHATRRLLAGDEPPDAIAAASDTQAAGAIRAIEEAGLRCPDDIAVTGFDDASWARLLSPALTTVRQPAAEMGAAAVDTVLAMIEDSSLEPPTIQLQGRLMVRESCGAHLQAAVQQRR
ncbi:MAG: substrate-binding domain-containing protein [Gaiellaceae bacterium]